MFAQIDSHSAVINANCREKFWAGMLHHKSKIMCGAVEGDKGQVLTQTD